MRPAVIQSPSLTDTSDPSNGAEVAATVSPSGTRGHWPSLGPPDHGLEQEPPPEYQPLLSAGYELPAVASSSTSPPGLSQALAQPTTSGLLALWRPPAKPSSEDASRRVAQLLQQAELVQKKGELDQAETFYGAADKVCRGAGLSYRKHYFVERPGEHADPLMFVASSGGNELLLLSLLKLAPRAKHFYYGSLFEQNAA